MNFSKDLKVGEPTATDSTVAPLHNLYQGLYVLWCADGIIGAVITDKDPVKYFKAKYQTMGSIGLMPHEVYWPEKAPSLCVWGSEFEIAVWRELLTIPEGKAISYSTIANRIGKPGYQRTVARACANNRIPYIIPCHRVVSGDRTLGGYSGGNGVKTKQDLLIKEGVDVRLEGSRIRVAPDAILEN